MPHLLCGDEIYGKLVIIVKVASVTSSFQPTIFSAFSTRLIFGHVVKRPGDLDLWPFDLYMGSRVNCVVGFLRPNSQLAAPFRYRLRPRHLTDRRTGRRRPSTLCVPLSDACARLTGVQHSSGVDCFQRQHLVDARKTNQMESTTGQLDSALIPAASPHSSGALLRRVHATKQSL